MAIINSGEFLRKIPNDYRSAQEHTLQIHVDMSFIMVCIHSMH